jgi:predicted amidohydrolase YtcJ
MTKEPIHTTADLVFRNGAVYRGSGAWDREPVAVVAGRILTCGPGGVGELISRDTRIVDLRGGSLVPGFQDSHVHPLLGGAALLGIDLSAVHSHQQYLELIRDYAPSHSEDAVLQGAGWYGDLYPGGFPVRQDLDAIVPQKPLILTSHDAHGMWVNSAALAAAGIVDATPDPLGGRILRDHHGAPTGVLLDTAMGLVGDLMPAHDPAYLRAAMLAAQQRLHSVGITSWQDAMVGQTDLGQDPFPVYDALVQEGLLTARVVAALWWDRDRGLDQIDELVHRRTLAETLPGISANTVKIMQDGMIENRTAAMLAPYSLPPSTDRGPSMIDPRKLAEATIRLDALGFSIHFHAVGDRAVRECLDAVESARRVNGTTQGRHQIAHLDVVDPCDMGRFAELGVSANLQMLWAGRDKEIVERKLPLLGREREARHFPFASLARAGAHLSAGSDWPVSDPNPLWAIYTGVHRMAPGEDVHAKGDDALSVPLEPAEALDFRAALDAYTAGSAWVNGLDHLTGVIRPGLAADLAWIDSDISDGEHLGSSTVNETFVSGATVYEA